MSKDTQGETRGDLMSGKTQMTIEWRHLELGGITCDRCSLTGRAILDVLEELQPYFRQKNVTARFIEMVLPDSQIEQSNQVIINGTPLEEYLSGAQVVQTPCCSCACITGQDETECRAIDVGGDRYEAIPPELLKKIIIGVVESWEASCCSGCGCGSDTNCNT
jgi:hypothetical protein